MKALTPSIWIRVVLNLPEQNSFDYCYDEQIELGYRVVVPLGKRKLIGVVIGYPKTPNCSPAKVRRIEEVLRDLPPFSPDWLRLTQFTAAYYQGSLGEATLSCIPSLLRDPLSYQGNPPLYRTTADALEEHQLTPAVAEGKMNTKSEKQEESQIIINPINFKVFLLHESVINGRNNSYLNAIKKTLSHQKQVLLMIPEIRYILDFKVLIYKSFLEMPQVANAITVLHSSLSNSERAKNWIHIQKGKSKIILGTRISIFAPFKNLGLIIVNNEHDIAYKRRGRLSYSARDLAIWRARDLNIPIILSSVTPSLESWHHVQKGYYIYSKSKNNIDLQDLPKVHIINTRNQKSRQGLSSYLKESISVQLRKGNQTLIFLNQRGYAPTLCCPSCNWVSYCPNCNVLTVLHHTSSQENRLQCHHCGYQTSPPYACPGCGNQSLRPLGYGTQRIEKTLLSLFPKARVARIDSDSIRNKKSAQALFTALNAGEIDILVGTKMVMRDSRFPKLGLIGVLNADNMLLTHDFRAPEHLFAGLMQLAWQASRYYIKSEILIQTRYPEQSIYQSFACYSYATFANKMLDERKTVGFPPFSYQALLISKAQDLSQSIAFLQAAQSLIKTECIANDLDSVTLYDPIPVHALQAPRKKCAQLLIESASRIALQNFLTVWRQHLLILGSQMSVSWHLDVDPLLI